MSLLARVTDSSDKTIGDNAVPIPIKKDTYLAYELIMEKEVPTSRFYVCIGKNDYNISHKVY